jgi:hypothetical protein
LLNAASIGAARCGRQVDGEHVPGKAGRADLGDDRTAAGEGGVHVLGQPRVVERRQASS